MSIRTIRTSVLAVVAASALAAGGLFAGRLLAGSLPDGPGSGGHFGGPRVFARMARALELTDDQKTRIKSLLRGHAPELETQLQAGADARRLLHDAILAQPIDEAAIRARAEELGRVQGEGAVLFARIHAEIAPVLTAEQNEKLQSIRSHMRDRGRRAKQELSDFLRRDGF